MKKKIDLEKLKKRYLEVGKVKPLVKEFKFSERTLRRYLNQAGIELKRGIRKGSILNTRDFGCLANWIRTHPKEGWKNEAAPTEISELTGCSLNAVKSYLWRRRDLLRKKIKKLDFSKLSGTIKTATGFPFPIQAIASWKCFLKGFTIEIDVLTKDGLNHKVKITPSEVDKLLKKQKEKCDVG